MPCAGRCSCNSSQAQTDLLVLCVTGAGLLRAAPQVQRHDGRADTGSSEGGCARPVQGGDPFHSPFASVSSTSVGKGRGAVVDVCSMQWLAFSSWPGPLLLSCNISLVRCSSVSRHVELVELQGTGPMVCRMSCLVLC